MKKRVSKINMVQMTGKPKEPEWKGEPFKLDSRTEVRQPASCKLSREDWEQKMIEKYSNYDKRNEKARLTGAAKNKLSVSSKLLKATNDL